MAYTALTVRSSSGIVIVRVRSETPSSHCENTETPSAAVRAAAMPTVAPAVTMAVPAVPFDVSSSPSLVISTAAGTLLDSERRCSLGIAS